MTAVLDIRDLSITFDTPAGPLAAVEGVSLSAARGEVLALVGESGSGKTVTGLALARLLPKRSTVTGRITIAGDDVLAMSPRELRRLRGRGVAYVFQEPMTALNPVLPVGRQIAEAVAAHHGLGRGAADERAVALLDKVGIPEPRRRAGQYIHQLSGGMRQRVMIAMAISGNPQVLVADEPTTALDATVQAQILDLLRGLVAESGMTMVFVSHDLGVVAEIADRVAVMYAGRIVEAGPTASLLAKPLMPYTRGLLNSLPEGAREGRLAAIPGQPVDPRRRPAGCCFAPRCDAVETPRCTAAEPTLETVGDRAVRCVRWRELSARLAVVASTAPAHDVADTPILEVSNLTKHFPISGGFWSRRVVRAVDGVSFDVRRGEVLGVVGESGSGKTTIGRCVLRLIEPSGGTICFAGREITHLPERELRPLRRAMQIVFQDPFASLNPRLSVEDIVGEAAVVHGVVARKERRERVGELLALVGLSADHATRRPHEFSGGQRQRIAIARALAVEPELVVADEAVSALDVSIRAQIVNLLQDLRARLSLSLLFISHDLALVRHLCDRVVVVYLGKVMEVGPARDVLEAPAHPYTRALASAVPTIDPATRAARIILHGDTPSPIDPPSGCVFRTRCARATSACAERVPPLREVAPGRFSACLYDP
jgi:peptide/nickel transport system ATP-binding protein